MAHYFTNHALLRYLSRACGFEREVQLALNKFRSLDQPQQEGHALDLVLSEHTPFTREQLAEHLSCPALELAIETGANRVHLDDLTFCIKGDCVTTIYERSPHGRPDPRPYDPGRHYTEIDDEP